MQEERANVWPQEAQALHLDLSAQQGNIIHQIAQNTFKCKSDRLDLSLT